MTGSPSMHLVSFEGRKRTKECSYPLPTIFAIMIFLLSLIYYTMTIWSFKALDLSGSVIQVINFLLWLPLFPVLFHRYSHRRPRDEKDANEEVALLPDGDSGNTFAGNFKKEENISLFAMPRFSTAMFKV